MRISYLDLSSPYFLETSLEWIWESPVVEFSIPLQLNLSRPESFRELDQAIKNLQYLFKEARRKGHRSAWTNAREGLQILQELKSRLEPGRLVNRTVQKAFTYFLNGRREQALQEYLLTKEFLASCPQDESTLAARERLMLSFGMLLLDMDQEEKTIEAFRDYYDLAKIRYELYPSPESRDALLDALDKNLNMLEEDVLPQKEFPYNREILFLMEEFPGHMDEEILDKALYHILGAITAHAAGEVFDEAFLNTATRLLPEIFNQNETESKITYYVIASMDTSLKRLERPAQREKFLLDLFPKRQQQMSPADVRILVRTVAAPTAIVLLNHFYLEQKDKEKAVRFHEILNQILPVLLRVYRNEEILSIFLREQRKIESEFQNLMKNAGRNTEKERGSEPKDKGKIRKEALKKVLEARSAMHQNLQEGLMRMEEALNEMEILLKEEDSGLLSDLIDAYLETGIFLAEKDSEKAAEYYHQAFHHIKQAENQGIAVNAQKEFQLLNALIAHFARETRIMDFNPRNIEVPAEKKSEAGTWAARAMELEKKLKKEKTRMSHSTASFLKHFSRRLRQLRTY